MGSSITCMSKSDFFSESVAEIRAMDLNFEYGYEKFSVYKCKHCKFYHLTTHKK